MLSVHLSLAEARSGLLDSFRFEFEVAAALEELWSPQTAQMEVEFSEREDFEPLKDVRFCIEPRDPTPWAVAFTPTFKKSIATVDKKIQGRVLAALSSLSESPVAVSGDTVKPLTGELKGLWRYRVGDYRLVYEPDSQRRIVVLLDFAARGGVYE